MTKSAPTPLALLVFAAAALGQGPEGVPTEHSVRIPPGALVDLDTGAVLPREQLGTMRADLHFDRDGNGFFVAPLHGGMVAADNATEPEGEWSTERFTIMRHRTREIVRFFVRTERGAVARISLGIADLYGTGSASLSWVLAPPAIPVFEPGPTELRTQWKGSVLEVTWSGESPRYLVEVETDGEIDKRTTDSGRMKLHQLDPDARHVVRVRGLEPDGVITLPAQVVQHGRTRPPVQKVVQYPDRWYDGEGGIQLQEGEPAGASADVVFYLYGVYVPGGGVQKLGQGEELFRTVKELPERGYLPSYGRLDNYDVLAVRLADGRYAKILLLPDDGADLRSGMSVHYAFLADGRRDFLPTPEGLKFERKGTAVQLTWKPVPGADRYEVLGPNFAAPKVVKVPQLRLLNAPKDRLFPVEVRALNKADASDRLIASVHTFDVQTHRLGEIVLEAQGKGVRLADESVGGADFDLRIESSAGGASYLRFATPHGGARLDAAPFGELGGIEDAAFGEHAEFDDRKAGTDVFQVRTKDGGFASIQVVAREYPRITLRYLLRLPDKR